MARKLLFSAFLLSLVLTGIAMRHQLTNASPDMAPPPQHAPSLEQFAAHFMSSTSSGDPAWQVVAGGGGKDIYLYDVGMTSADEGWAVGSTGPSSYGVIMHYTNTTWSKIAAPTGTYWINSVAMISSTEGWATGGWACTYSTDCDHGLLMHYITSTGWQTATTPARPDGFYWSGFTSIDIKGTTGWAVGYDNYYLRFNGTGWSPVSTPYDSAGVYVSVIDANEAWAAGSRFLHFSGGSWSVVTPTLPTTATIRFRGIHMLNASEGWAVGYLRYFPSGSYECLMSHYDGNTWARMDCPPNAKDARLYSVRMRSSNDVWAVGRDGIMLHWDGFAWTSMAAPPGTSTLNSVRLVGTNDGWSVGAGGTILRLVYGNWTRINGSELVVGPLDAVTTNEAWYGGSAGQLYQWKNGSITTYSSPVTTSITALDMVSPTVGWATANRPDPQANYQIIRYADGVWTTWPSVKINAIAAISAEEGWEAPDALGGGLSHYQSGTWQWQRVPTNASDISQYAVVESISMLDANHGWVIGYTGSSMRTRQAYTYTNGTWAIVTPTLSLVSGYSKLKVIAISPNEAWVASWLVACDVMGCPASPILYHFSGGKWTNTPTTNWLAFFDISKVSATEWWAAGKLKTMEYAFLHYKDGSYTVVPAAEEDVTGVSMLPDGTGFARGVGSLLRLTYPVSQTAGVTLAASQSGTVYPGQSLVYQHTLTNTGTGTDSFTVTASIDRPGWSVIAVPSIVGPLNAGVTSGVVVTVTAPGGITATVTATARITATSRFDINVTSAVTDVTTARPYQVYLPLVIK